MLIYFSDIEYHPRLPFYAKPLGEPMLPHRFDNKHHVRHYYDHVKCFVQLNHDGTKDGCRQLLKRYIHRDHQKLVKLVKKYFYTGVQGRKDERVRSFWAEFGKIVRRIEITTVLNTPNDMRPMRSLAHFAKRLEREYEESPETFFQETLTHLQSVFVQWPNAQYVDVLLGILGSKKDILNRIMHNSDLSRSFSVRYEMSDVVGEGFLVPKFRLHEDVNVLDFIRKLTQALVEASLLIKGSWDTSSHEDDTPATRCFDPCILEKFNDLTKAELAIINKGESVVYPHHFTSEIPHYSQIQPSRPTIPRSFVSKEQCQWYYDTVKQYVQLTHNGTLFGFRDLLLHYIHTDQNTSLKVLVKSYGAGHQSGEVLMCRGCFHCSLGAFWNEWEKILCGQVQRYLTSDITAVMNSSLKSFERKLDDLKSLGYPMRLFKEEMVSMQIALGKFPNWKLSERLVRILDAKLAIRECLHTLHDCLEVELCAINLKPSVCVLMFMRELTQVLVEWVSRRVFTRPQKSASPLPCLDQSLNDSVPMLKEPEQRPRSAGNSCDFCGEDMHTMEKCDKFGDLLGKGLLRYNTKGELCMRTGIPLVVETKPFMKTSKLKNYLHDCGDGEAVAVTE